MDLGPLPRLVSCDGGARVKILAGVPSFITQSGQVGGNGPQPFGKIEHALTIVAVSHERVFYRMEEAPPAAAVGQSVVTRVKMVAFRFAVTVLRERAGACLEQAFSAAGVR